MTSHISLVATVPADRSGSRFDQVAADLFPDFSRSRIQSWIKDGSLTKDGMTAKVNAKLIGGEKLILEATLKEEGEWVAQDIPLNAVYEDNAIIVIDKPAGLVVHPAAGNWDGTLLNGLLFRYPELATVPRAGIVHRLDKDTSGLMVVARTIESQTQLVDQLQARSVKRIYSAIVIGNPNLHGKIDAPIGRHPTMRTKMAVVKSGGKPAVTHYERMSNFDGFAHVRLKLETGRTHQIRVHMAHIGFPLVGDQQYGKSFSPQQLQKHPELKPLAGFPRQALHAKELGLVHPVTKENVEWTSSLPEDFMQLLSHLKDVY